MIILLQNIHGYILYTHETRARNITYARIVFGKEWGGGGGGGGGGIRVIRITRYFFSSFSSSALVVVVLVNIIRTLDGHGRLPTPPPPPPGGRRIVCGVVVRAYTVSHVRCAAWPAERDGDATDRRAAAENVTILCRDRRAPLVPYDL